MSILLNGLFCQVMHVMLVTNLFAFLFSCLSYLLLFVLCILTYVNIFSSFYFFCLCTCMVILFAYQLHNCLGLWCCCLVVTGVLVIITLTILVSSCFSFTAERSKEATNSLFFFRGVRSEFQPDAVIADSELCFVRFA